MSINRLLNYVDLYGAFSSVGATRQAAGGGGQRRAVPVAVPGSPRAAPKRRRRDFSIFLVCCEILKKLKNRKKTKNRQTIIEKSIKILSF